MKFRIITAALFSCLLLCSCKSSDSSQANDTAAAFTDNADEKSGTEKTSVPVQEAASNGSTDTASDNAVHSGGEIDFSDNTVSAEDSSPAAPTEADETKASLESGNNMPDDGLNWSPLTPVS